MRGARTDRCRRPRARWRSSRCSRSPLACTRNGSPPTRRLSFLPESIRRLNYPVDYWNGLAAMVAIGPPMMLWLAGDGEAARGARRQRTGVIPAMALTGYMTLSRGGAVETAVALVVFIALHPRSSRPAPDRAQYGSREPPARSGLAGRREDLADGLSTPLAASQADEMILDRPGRLHSWSAWPSGRSSAPGVVASDLDPKVSRRTAIGALAGGVVVVVVLGLAAGGSGQVSRTDGRPSRPRPVPPQTTPFIASRVQAATAVTSTGTGRAGRRRERAPDRDGPGTYEFVWARGQDTLTDFVRDAHSLYFETFAELGIVGLALVVGLIAFVCRRRLQAGARGGSRAPGRARRSGGGVRHLRRRRVPRLVLGAPGDPDLLSC